MRFSIIWIIFIEKNYWYHQSATTLCYVLKHLLQISFAISEMISFISFLLTLLLEWTAVTLSCQHGNCKTHLQEGFRVRLRSSEECLWFFLTLPFLKVKHLHSHSFIIICFVFFFLNSNSYSCLSPSGTQSLETKVCSGREPCGLHWMLSPLALRSFPTSALVFPTVPLVADSSNIMEYNKRGNPFQLAGLTVQRVILERRFSRCVSHMVHGSPFLVCHELISEFTPGLQIEALCWTSYIGSEQKLCYL